LNKNDLGRRHNKDSNGILASKCVFVGAKPADYGSLYRFPQNRECLAVWKEKLSKSNTVYLV